MKIRELLKVIKEGTKGKKYLISILIPDFIDWLSLDLNLAPQTLEKHKECLDHVIRYIGDLDIREMTSVDVLNIKKEMNKKKLSPARINSIIFALRKLLRFCDSVLNIKVLDPAKMIPLKIKQKQVVYLTNKEIDIFRKAINTSTRYGKRFRALFETLLSSGLRISEALSLDRDSINYEKKEANIVGKGGRPRTVYFNDDAITRINIYLETRWDDEPALFVTHGGEPTRLKRGSVEQEFSRYRKFVNIKKKVTAHTLRHSFCTNLHHHGLDILWIKELAGHRDIQTTAKYYIGTSKKKIKEAHRKYLNFNN
jgi:integrase/recombinase XerD